MKPAPFDYLRADDRARRARRARRNTAKTPACWRVASR